MHFGNSRRWPGFVPQFQFNDMAVNNEESVTLNSSTDMIGIQSQHKEKTLREAALMHIILSGRWAWGIDLEE